ncbi:MAG: cytochrome C oxidase subunit IV family protein [Myxococcales bacterium]|nr:cytochrome C oxidase subunit IV family protein [Myxococcales bacterium]
MAESALPSEKLHPDREEPHAHSAVPYVIVWIVLLFFTALTYVTGTMHLGKWALPIALAIACVKSALVVLIFMHLKESSGTTRLVFVTALIFLGLLMFFTVADVATRFKLATPAGAPFGTERSQPEGLLEHEMPAEPEQ